MDPGLCGRRAADPACLNRLRRRYLAMRHRPLCSRALRPRIDLSQQDSRPAYTNQVRIGGLPDAPKPAVRLRPLKLQGRLVDPRETIVRIELREQMNFLNGLAAIPFEDTQSVSIRIERTIPELDQNLDFRRCNHFAEFCRMGPKPVPIIQDTIGSLDVFGAEIPVQNSVERYVLVVQQLVQRGIDIGHGVSSFPRRTHRLLDLPRSLNWLFAAPTADQGLRLTLLAPRRVQLRYDDRIHDVEPGVTSAADYPEELIGKDFDEFAKRRGDLFIWIRIVVIEEIAPDDPVLDFECA